MLFSSWSTKTAGSWTFSSWTKTPGFLLWSVSSLMLVERWSWIAVRKKIHIKCDIWEEPFSWSKWWFLSVPLTLQIHKLVHQRTSRPGVITMSNVSPLYAIVKKSRYLNVQTGTQGRQTTESWTRRDLNVFISGLLHKHKSPNGDLKAALEAGALCITVD